MGMPTAVAIPMQPSKIGLELLIETLPVVMPPPLDGADYPKLRHSWEEKDWEDWASTGKEEGLFDPGVQGAGVNSSWMQRQDGERVELARQKKILKGARRIWVTMKDFGIVLKPEGGIPLPTLNYFRAAMESQFFELRLCADHWKTDRVWTENFSSWRNPPRRSKTHKGDSDRASQPELVSGNVSRL